MTQPPEPPIADVAPDGDALTDYDRSALKLYARLLDAERAGAPWQEVVALLFGMDPDAEPDRAWRAHDSHLRRARWLAAHGYRDLLGRDR